MEEKTRRIGKFNIIDIIAVILILAVLAFAGWKLLGSSGGGADGETGMVKVTYVVRCEGVPAELYETCKAHLPSDLMASGALVGGQIESVEMEPYYVLGPDGEWVEDPEWRKTGDFKVDCDDRKAILMLNAVNPKQENLEEVIVHELMHLKLYPLDQITESLITSHFEEGTPAWDFAYRQFFESLEITVEELAKCFLLEFGENKELSFGRCKLQKSFDELYDGLKNLE